MCAFALEKNISQKVQQRSLVKKKIGRRLSSEVVDETFLQKFMRFLFRILFNFLTERKRYEKIVSQEHTLTRAENNKKRGQQTSERSSDHGAPRGRALGLSTPTTNGVPYLNQFPDPEPARRRLACVSKTTYSL